MAEIKVNVVGGGLAGCEAAYFLAEKGIPVTLHEMRPKKMTEAHQTNGLAELVCSNSLKSDSPVSAPGILKSEMKSIGSLILSAAEETKVPAGESLSVDREKFSQFITSKIDSHPLIDRCHDEVTEPFPNEITLFATGPLTSKGLSQWIQESTKSDSLYFYDAIAPIVDAETIDRSKVFLANRYGKGGEQAYLNCPFTKEEYESFIDALMAGEKVAPKNFEKENFFQGCQPIEAIADRGRDTLRFGPMKPVGLTNPNTPDEKPYAIVQLRPENLGLTAYNLVGFQTKLKYGEQKRIFRMIPGLESAEFLRLGAIHRNTYICGPEVLRSDLSLKDHPLVYFAGQITGVEGYLESSACGLMSALSIWQRINGKPIEMPPLNTALGSLLRFIVASDTKNYQPMNIQYGIMDPIYYEDVIGKKKDIARKKIADQSDKNMDNYLERVGVTLPQRSQKKGLRTLASQLGSLTQTTTQAN